MANSINEHWFGKLKQAEKNVLRVTYGRAKFRRLRYWTRAFNRAIDKAIPLPKL